MMVRNWIEKCGWWNVKRIILVICVIVSLGSVVGCGRKIAEDSDEWQKQMSTAVASQTYQDETGNKIVYYCCKTTYHKEGIKPEDGKLDRQTLSAVIDWETVEEEKESRVREWPAVLCQEKDRTYLCWTISPEYSCIIEYDAEAVEEEDIFHMAESVVRQ
jgi:DNA-directed RNA polymerase subunit N (RpoN/RPB10)